MQDERLGPDVGQPGRVEQVSQPDVVRCQALGKHALDVGEADRRSGRSDPGVGAVVAIPGKGLRIGGLARGWPLVVTCGGYGGSSRSAAL